MSSKYKTIFSDFWDLLRYPSGLIIGLPLIFFVFGLLFNRFRPTDPDLWWHLNVGRDILHSGIQFKDIYSSSMKGYEWVDHEWLLNVIYYFFFSISNNFIFIASIIGVAVFLCFYFQAKSGITNTKTNTAQLAIWVSVLIGLIGCLSSLGLRAQTPTLIGITLLCGLINSEQGKSDKWFLLKVFLLFLLWANLHAGFVFGLVLLTIRLVFRDKVLAVKSLLVGSIASLINPYGYKVYSEIFNTLSDSFIKQYIVEWQMLNPQRDNHLSIIAFFLLWLILLIFIKLKERSSRFNASDILIFLLAIYIGITGIRFNTIVVLLLLPTFSKNLEHLLSESFGKLNPWIMRVIMFAGFLSLFIAADFAIIQFKGFVKSNTQTQTFTANYPQKALEKLMQLKSAEIQVFNEYGWGGFISWYTKNKVSPFIDGRMPSWRLVGGKTALQNYELFYYGQMDESCRLPKTEYFLLSTKTYKNLGWEKCLKIIYTDKVSIIAKKESEITFPLP
jgi:hypothetical protein